MISNIDFLIVGAGLYGATIGRLLTDKGYKCLVIDQRNHIGGNIYTESVNGYDKHVYGPHIFHANDDNVIEFANKYSKWDQYVLNTIAIDENNKIYHLPFNMHTYYDIFNVSTPEDAHKKLADECAIAENIYKDRNDLEAIANKLVGSTIYKTLIKEYTEKQWDKKCSELPGDIIKRLPLRFNFDNNYFYDKFQGIPTNGYSIFVKNILEDILYLCNYAFTINDYTYWAKHIKYKIIYCGAPDKLLNYNLGELSWRSLKFEDERYIYNGYNGQGNAIVNDVSKKLITRKVEHMWFKPNKIYNGIESIITSEYPENWDKNKEPYYPINNEKTNELYNEYCDYIKEKFSKIFLGGRLGKYKYFDMDDTIIEAMNDAKKIIMNINEEY